MEIRMRTWSSSTGLRVLMTCAAAIVIGACGRTGLPCIPTAVSPDPNLQFDTNPPGLPFRVEIPGSPFTKKPVLVIKDRKPRVLAAEGRFFWKCFLRRASDKKFVGWFWGENPESGGDVDVRP